MSYLPCKCGSKGRSLFMEQVGGKWYYYWRCTRCHTRIKGVRYKKDLEEQWNSEMGPAHLTCLGTVPDTTLPSEILINGVLYRRVNKAN